jgi:hypothetical protein
MLSLISESDVEIQICIHLARGKPNNTMYTLSPGITYDYLLLSPSEVKIAPLDLGRNLGSTVIDRLGRCPGLPHSPSNINHRVAITV